MKTLEKKAVKVEGDEKIKYPMDKIVPTEAPINARSFAEQYLEKPVAYGKYATENGLTVTTCTFRNIPLIDDY